MNKNNWILSLVLILWLAVIGCGFAIILDHEFKASSKATQIRHWPPNTKLTLDSELDTLLIFIHPHCPCSRASLAELNRLLTSFHHKLNTIVLFSKPDGKDDSWVKGDLWNQAQRLPNTQVYLDDNNTESQKFITNTSGEILLFRKDGILIYHGGITASRGHEGDNKGKSLISKYLKTGKIPKEEGEAFGCIL